jgi:hypothetical protein
MDDGHLSGEQKTTKGHGLVARTTGPLLKSRDASWNASKFIRLRRMLPQWRGAHHQGISTLGTDCVINSNAFESDDSRI